jgi:hypothetical protein
MASAPVEVEDVMVAEPVTKAPSTTAAPVAAAPITAAPATAAPAAEAAVRAAPAAAPTMPVPASDASVGQGQLLGLLGGVVVGGGLAGAALFPKARKPSTAASCIPVAAIVSAEFGLEKQRGLHAANF